jgi:phosphatidylserine/phosphatidylglycerophosphate/cardiolipin synthase-like enzyme
MSDFSIEAVKDGLKLKLWRGERMCLIGMDVESPEADFVGFAIEVKRPGATEFMPLRNRLNFSYQQTAAGTAAAAAAVTGARQYPSLDAPFQKFRWIHFPQEPQLGSYTYRVTKMHMPSDGKLVAGTQLAAEIPLNPITYEGYLDIGFTRNFASSQIYAERYHNNPDIIPAKADGGLKFKKVAGDVYQWLGFEAVQMIFDFLNQAADDPTVSLDVLAYDLNEPDIVAALEKLGPRLRIVIDNSKNHLTKTTAESQAAARLAKSAGKDNVRRTHFKSLQHHKVLIAKRGGKPFKVLFGSTNFSFRGFYIQANNALRFDAPEAAALFGRMFEVAFDNPLKFGADPIAKQWQLVHVSNAPLAHLCFSPHKSANLSLDPVGAAIQQASSSVLFSIAFLNQIKSGPTRQAIDALMEKNVFSYGIADKTGGLNIHKPDGSIATVDFAYLAANAPEPFKSDWSGGAGIHIHHKFVVTDFSLPAAKVFSGSSNLSPAGETGNGDNLVMIEDSRVATAYAIEAVRMFDHLHLRTLMQAKASPKAKGKSAKAKKPAAKSSHAALTLRKPENIGGKPAWFTDYYKSDSQAERDRKLFAGA